MIPEMYIRGTQVNYYFICKTKLWLFSHNITMEQESDAVNLGKLLHEETFRRDEKDVQIGPISIDIIRKGDVLEIREVKKSKSLMEAHVYQTLYYLYYMHKFGIKAKGILSFPKSRENIEIKLGEEEKEKLERILEDIQRIVAGDMPPPTRSKICKRCAYFEFCFS
ncbi:CRISPR-associated protein Cas4 [Methermicoccus shengliensis]|uniref:CRISPR-associated protein Cas4 n=1 Tax=Methermicoccus shengliensis TaxID=660064 RepID=UPI0005B2D9C1|nr:CRISPR-associated protein Cas4 [Methermicoccus shengliensis]